nr:hypothetical protein [Candidatus Woesearchaeota archaeon]
MANLERTYVMRANLSNNLVAKEAVDIFSKKSLMAMEVRFQRVPETELMYDSYYIPETRNRPTTSNFDLDVVVSGLSELEGRLTILTMGERGPTIRIIKPNENKDLYAVFVNPTYR